MSKPNWAFIRNDLSVRLAALEAIHEALEAETDPAKRELLAQTWQQLAIPNLQLLAEFCINIEISEGEP